MRSLQNFPTAVVASRPFPLSAAAESLRTTLASVGEAVNSQIANHGASLYAAAGRTALRGVIGQMTVLRRQLDGYLGLLTIEQPAAVQATLAALGTARQSVAKSLVAAGFDPKHPQHASHVNAHPTVTEAAAVHEGVNHLPINSWRGANDQELKALANDLVHLAG